MGPVRKGKVRSKIIHGEGEIIHRLSTKVDLYLSYEELIEWIAAVSKEILVLRHEQD